MDSLLETPPPVTIVYVQSRCRKNKIKHPTEESARRHFEDLAAREAIEGTKLGRKLKIYWCDEHSCFHVGHKRIPVPLAALREEILALYETTRAKGTYLLVRTTFDDLERAGLETAGGLTEQFILRFVKEAPARWSSMTLAGKLRNIRRISNYCLDHRYIKLSPFKRRRIPELVKAVPSDKVRFFTREEIRRVLDLMRADVEHSEGWACWRARRLLALTAFTAYLGTRAAEAQRARVEDLDLEHRAFLVKGTKTAGSSQPIALPEALVPILEDWLRHRLDHPEGYKIDEQSPWLFPSSRRHAPWWSGSPGTKPIDRLRAVGERAGIHGLTFISLRHSWATLAEGLGIPEEAIRRNLRHTTVQTSRKFYRHTNVKMLAAAVKDFDF